MTDQEQQIALCEWMGWKQRQPDSNFGESFINPKGVFTWNLPNTSSLDVLHEMEKKLTDQQLVRYCHNIQKLMDTIWDAENLKLNPEPILVAGTWKSPKSIAYFCTTAPQRREALLKTLGLWKEL